MPPNRGKHARATGQAASAMAAPASGAAIDEAEVDRMLAQLAAESSEPLGRLAGRFDTRAGKVGLMLGGTVCAGLLILLLMTVVGALL